MHGSNMGQRSAAQALVDQLVLHGVEHVFCVPGESYLPVLDALYDTPQIQVTVCRQEGGAAMMAEAVGRATGRPGVCFVTRGPGATNASAGVYIAHQDCTPMILFAGQVDRRMRDREAWQEMDFSAVFGSMSKWAGQIDRGERMAEYVSRAFHTASAGRQGPVVLALPRDMLDDPTEPNVLQPVSPLETAPGADELAQLQDLIEAAERPLLIVGGSRWDEASYAAIHRFAERFELPTLTSYRRGSLFDPDHRCYGGDLGLGANPKLIARVKAADLLILAGGRLGEVASQGYSLLDIPAPKVKLVHIHPGAEEIGRVYQPHLAIHASPRRFAPALAALTPRIARGPAEAEAAHRDYLDWSDAATPQPGALNFGEVMVWLRGHLPPETMLCNGAGAYAAWIHRFYRFRRLGTHMAPAVASMGYGVPAAVAMKRLYPERPVLCVAGDGDFLMNGQEFATAVQYKLPFVTLVVDNASYGSIRMNQEMAFPGRVSATDLVNPDFAAYARAFGGYGATVERTEDFADAFCAAEASGLPAILHLKIDPEVMTPGSTLSQIRERALAGR
ncbi:thiamine pyrophosphate-binding protein [Caulobacter sp. S45]|uniref:thiamine pyrophosphate-binding protein n=1 Tax=Caulobacter sp. S45 TaxID=1641861 RepID=UPI0020B14BE7|nr:thiamine pyrophosphate-binding protein [Caulobacter sp. S45]